MLGFQALVTGVKAIAENLEGGEASLGGTSRGGTTGYCGVQSGEWAGPTQASNTDCQSFCPKETGSVEDV